MEIRTRMAYINMVDAAGSWRSSRKLAERQLRKPAILSCLWLKVEIFLREMTSFFH